MKARVLFAEDQAAIRELFSEVLRREGLSVTSCATAHEACDRIAAEPFDLVITDMRMENPRAGYQVIRAAQKLTHPLPVVLLTAFPIPLAQLRGYPVAAVVMKGTALGALLASVREAVSHVA